MKKALIALAILALASTAQAEISTVTTNYFTNAVFIADEGNYSNSTGGLVIGFEVAELNLLTEAQASNDVRALMFNMMLYLNDQIQALASTNRMAKFTVYETTGSSSASDFTVQHSISTDQNIGTITIPAE